MIQKTRTRKKFKWSHVSRNLIFPSRVTQLFYLEIGLTNWSKIFYSAVCKGIFIKVLRNEFQNNLHACIINQFTSPNYILLKLFNFNTIERLYVVGIYMKTNFSEVRLRKKFRLKIFYKCNQMIQIFILRL